MPVHCFFERNGENIMKKFGQLCFTTVPVLLVFVIENLALIFFWGIVGLVEALYLAATGTVSFSRVYQDTVELMSDTNFNTYIMVMYALISIAFYGLWYYVKYNGSFRPEKRVFQPLSILGILMMVPGTQYLTSYLVTFLSILFPSWLERYEELLEASGMDDSLTFGLVLYSVILAPIAEELLCRGVTLGQAKKILPFWLANLLQAFLFGALHMNMLQGTYAFCLGLILGYIYEKSGSIYMAILFHILYNFCGTILSQYLFFGETVFSFLFWFVFGLAMTIGGVAVYQMGTRKASEPVETASTGFWS